MSFNFDLPQFPHQFPQFPANFPQVKHRLVTIMTTPSPTSRTLTLPKRDGTTEVITTNSNLLFVGANGAGKTRLGTWLEFQSPQQRQVLRISAQKSLAMPDSTTPKSIELAERSLLYGHETDQSNKAVYKFQQKPATSLLNDFDKLMVFLFSDETEENAKYKIAQRSATSRIEPPLTRLDRIKNAWERILPHRELVIGGLRIQTRVRSDPLKIYNSSDMSDGERVIFYLLGQCLAAPADGIIVIDEPELHLHKSVQAPLWSEVEKLRPDCLFVYLTHDVDFAAAQEGAQKVWLKSFDGASWDWELIREDNHLPDELLIEVLGSRKPVVFVEGDNGSDDVSLYREIFPGFLVIPRGNCTQVILSAKALRANTQLHHLQVYGLIDRDRRSPAEIAALEQSGIFTLSVAEVENLFCTREVLEVVSKRLERNHATDYENVVAFVFGRLQTELDTQISLRVAEEIKFKLNLFDATVKGAPALEAALRQLASNIDVPGLYSDFSAEFGRVIASQDYDTLLALYNRKSMASQVCSALGLKAGELSEFIIRIARSGGGSEIRTALRPYLGTFGTLVA